ncbi:hypothetical protein BKA93DRAFT_826890 [Sparassis latifolia]|uniref:GDP/GTP exchange factor Sec2 N-terminal domain-containing protein n=1 Tax=Sparassis crispa TaxID=139825 RepID=A0A401GNW4_9APHY|nr:hypothetical protein SCP_0508960 [Sparassis crispa]GBE83839.1 hypothetical protein SCP_0508960 [Sparassis crispa]
MPHARVFSVDSEMHELNQEADLLDQKTTVVPRGVNGQDAHLRRRNSDPDAQAMVIASLRSQIQDLFGQVSQLNNKLVGSYDRMSNLEDELHVTTSNLRSSTLKISNLELERSQHLSAVSTGLLVEKDNVTAELTRLMERATDEAAQRGQAESARAEIEKDLDDLSASLFNQANSMVAEARMAQARSERKVEETERALRGAEEVVGVLQAQMQALEAEKETADRRVEDMRVTMGKGKWVERSQERSRSTGPRLLSSHAPYQEYLAFISHLRSIRPASQQPPAMSTLLPQPFLARLVTEDSDPTVRLDLAPSLNWLSRRSVLSAIHSGQLTVEPMSTTTLLEELAPSVIPGTGHSHVMCALCGFPIFGSSSASDTPLASNGLPRSSLHNNSWSSSLFKNSLVQSISSPNPSHKRDSLPPPATDPPSQIYIFRLDATSSGLPVSLPVSSQQPAVPARQSTIYPLCTTRWCLMRLRTTCSLWAFVRTCVVEKVWEESLYVSPTPNGSEKPALVNGVSGAERPPVPPRRSRMGIGMLWGSVQRSLSSGVTTPEKEEKEPQIREKPEEKTLPKSPPPTARRIYAPPPTHPSKSASLSSVVIPGSLRAVPPPLPPRNRQRGLTSKANLSTTTVDRVDGAEKPDATGSTGHEDVSHTKEPLAAEHLPPPIAHAESQDQFATPKEGPASLASSRPGTPSTIPLPLSSPPTPEPEDITVESVQPPTQELVTADSLQPVSTEAAEPVAAEPIEVALAEPATTDAPAPNQPETEKAAPAAPPPLPRRAAARVRVSMAPEPAQSEAPPVVETNGFASNGTEPGATAQEEAATVEASKVQPTEDDETVHGQPTTEAVEPADAEQDESAETEAEQSDDVAQLNGETATETPTEDERTAAASPALEELKDADESLYEAPSEDAPSYSTSASVNGAAERVEGKSLNGAPDSDTSIEPKETSEEERSSDESTGAYIGAYVGDASWEERTWKELVRLREEMFWARIGGVR